MIKYIVEVWDLLLCYLGIGFCQTMPLDMECGESMHTYLLCGVSFHSREKPITYQLESVGVMFIESYLICFCFFKFF